MEIDRIDKMLYAPLYAVLTVSEVMEEFHLSSRSNIVLACILGRVAARKVDAHEFDKGGHWLISRKSAEQKWGYRK